MFHIGSYRLHEVSVGLSKFLLRFCDMQLTYLCLLL